MNIKPVASPHQVLAAQNSPIKGPSPRERALNAWKSADVQPAQPVVQNQTAVTPEEMTAIKPATSEVELRPAQTLEEVVEQSGTPDPVPAEKLTPKPAEDTASSRQFAQLARQEKALRAKAQQQEQAFKAREAQLAVREAEIAAKDTQYKTSYIPKDILKQDPLSVLAEAGVSYDELTQQILNQQPTNPRTEAAMSRLEAKIRQLEEQAEQGRKSAAEQQTQAYQAAVKQIRTDVDALIKSDPAFETIKATRSSKDVVDLIEQVYQKDGVLLTVEEAATQVEDYLMEEAMKITRIDKIKKKLGLAAQPKPVTSNTQPPSEPQKPQMKTLTNSTASTRKLNAKERAILAFKGELKG